MWSCGFSVRRDHSRSRGCRGVVRIVACDTLCTEVNTAWTHPAQRYILQGAHKRAFLLRLRDARKSACRTRSDSTTITAE